MSRRFGTPARRLTRDVAMAAAWRGGGGLTRSPRSRATWSLVDQDGRMGAARPPRRSRAPSVRRGRDRASTKPMKARAGDTGAQVVVVGDDGRVENTAATR